MAITLSHTPGVIRRFRRTRWKFQHTFHTPLQNLAPFVSTIISALESIRGGTVTIEQVIPFESRHLSPLLERHGIPSPYYDRDWSIEATGRDEAESLLHAALGDWLDFIFVPDPAPFTIYADHDEYATHTRSNLNRVVQPLDRSGFKRVEYQRDL
jgi:hypothetical protein